ncbi:MAG: hypothetical protein KDK65_01110 [Chlamydiia bacterium]|nr:hypothetical protein [Chlamydiia bacterium]
MARLSFQQLHALYKKEKSFSDDVIRALGEKQAEAWKKFCPPKRSQPSESGVRSQLLGMGLQPTDESGKIWCQVGDLGVFYFSPDTDRDW